MRFYKGVRPSMFFQGGRPKMDKSNKRCWRVNLAISIKAAEILACGELIQKAYEAIDTRENKCKRYEINEDVPDMIVRFYALDSSSSPELVLRRVRLENLAMTRDPLSGSMDLWVSFEHEMTDALHAWVKKYFGSRFFAEFEGAQLDLLADQGNKAMTGELPLKVKVKPVDRKARGAGKD